MEAGNVRLLEEVQDKLAEVSGTCGDQIPLPDLAGIGASIEDALDKVVEFGDDIYGGADNVW